MQRIFTFLFFLCLAVTLVMAQELSVKGFDVDPSDLSASTHRRNDANGQACALVKVRLARPGATFLGNVMGGTPYSQSVYMVYMMHESKYLEVRLDGYLPVKVNFTDYGFKNGVESLTTYVLSITLPNVTGQPEDDGMSYFTLTVTPKNASVQLDGDLKTLNEEGVLSLRLARGPHSYKLAASGYTEKEKSFILGTERLDLAETLVSSKATLSVTCATSGADIYINDEKKGRSSWSGSIDPGHYLIEARKEGFITQQKSITLSDNQSLKVDFPALMARVGQLDINYMPINAEVVIDGEKKGTSPNMFKNLTVGSHRVEIRKEGYQSEMKTVTIAEGQTATLNGSLSATTTSSTSTVAIVSSNTKELTVKSFALNPYDLTASAHRRNDANGQACALVKVRLERPGATFDGNVMGDTPYSMGEYYVYMMKGSRMLQVKLDGYLPVKVNFADYGIAGVEPLSTYILTLVLPNVTDFSAISTSSSTSSSSLSSSSSSTSNITQSDPTTSDDKKTFTVNGVSFTMIRVEGGTFTMGATSEQGNDAYDSEKPAHQVKLSSYSIGETEVTQELWEAVMSGNPSNIKGAKRPVDQVSWDDCLEFIKKLNKLTKKSFRLPTEAEWEYASRGGSKCNGYKYSGSNTLGDVAWYTDNSGYTTHNVATRQSNELGLYDMSGNVWEWCSDWYGSYSSGNQTNPQGANSGRTRVGRGGGWGSIARYCRSSYRDSYDPGSRDIGLGLRLVLSE